MKPTTACAFPRFPAPRALLHVALAGWLAGAALAQEVKILASDAAAGDRFGSSVATAAKQAAVGAPAAGGAGAVYGYRRHVSGFWQEDQKLTASDGAQSDAFGAAVAMQGETLVVGAPRKDEAGNDDGVVYVYGHDGAAWGDERKLVASDPDHGDGFGEEVALDGDVLVVAAPWKDDLSGAAYVYRFDGSDWGFEQKLVGTHPGSYRFFGDSVAVADDLIAVGASYFGVGAIGRVFLYRFDGQQWELEATVHRGSSTQFGHTVALQGDMLVAGRIDTGAAYVYRGVEGVWEEVQELSVAGGAAARFGSALGLDGARLVVAARGDDSSADDAGALYLYTYDGCFWRPAGQRTASDAEEDDELGSGLALVASYVLTGAPGEDDAGSDAGALYEFPFSEAGDGAVLYVDQHATGANDGSSWEDAYVYLQDAFGAAEAGDEIWVAAGTYRPDDGVGQVPGDRSASFALESDVALYGGFRGDEECVDERRPWVNVSTLSGDLLENDQVVPYSNYSDNSDHVVTADGVTGALMDGFYVYGGNATLSGEIRGGGLLMEDSEVVLRSCHFFRNLARYGGAVYALGQAPNGGRVSMEYCEFFENQATLSGGAIVADSTDLAVERSLFSENRSLGWGGGITGTNSADCTLVNCELEDNTALTEGGGLYLHEGAAATLVHGTLVRNHAGAGAGGVWVGMSSAVTAVNSILWGNLSPAGPTELAQISGPGSIQVDYCCIQGLLTLGGTGNTDADPTLDRYDHLIQGSPVADAGDAAAVPAGVEIDRDGAPRIQGATVDMGAYELGCVYGVTYCTAKTSSCGVPQIDCTGRPSAVDPWGFLISAAPARANKNGIVLYSEFGRAAIPFSGGLLCVAPQFKRSRGVNSGGTNGCEGRFVIDFNAFARGRESGNPAGFLHTIGQQVTCQWWARDSLAFGAYISDGLEFTLLP